MELPVTLHPIFPEAGESVEGIEGFWRMSHEDTGLEIRAEAPGVYGLILWDKDRPSPDEAFSLRFGRAGGELFWEMTRKDLEPDTSLGVIPVHIPALVRLGDGDLELAFLSGDGIRAALESGELELPHTMVDDTLVLTASPDELQAFLRDQGGRAEFFDTPAVFHRTVIPCARCGAGRIRD